MRRLLPLLLLLIPCVAQAQNARVDDIAFKGTNPAQFAPAATITVCTSAGTGLPCTPKVSGLCSSASDVTCNQPNPTTADSVGNFGFWIQPGTYVATVTGSGLSGFSKTLVLTCPLAGSCALTGNNTHSGTETFNGPVIACSSNGQLFVGCATYPATAAGINAAIQALPASPTGGTIWLPGGVMNMNATIVIDRPVVLRGQLGGYNGRGSSLNCTGTAIPLITISGAAGISTSSMLQDLTLDNTGTCTIAVDIDNNSVFVKLWNVYSVPTIPFSVAGVRVGNNTAGNFVFNVWMENTDFENNPINLLLLRCFHFVGTRTRWVNGSVNSVQIGDATHIVDSAHFYGGDIEPNTTNNVTEINVLNGSDIEFDGVFGEQNGASSFWLDCPATATNCNNIVDRGSWHQSNAGAQNIFHVNLAGATLSVEASEANNFPASSFWVKNDSSRRVWLNNLVGDSANISLLTSNTNASFGPSNSGANLSGWWFNDPGFFRGDVTFSTNTSAASAAIFASGTAHAGSSSQGLLWYEAGDQFLHGNYNNTGTQQIPQVVLLHTAYTNATTTFSNLSDGTRAASFAVKASTDYTVSCKLLFQGSVTTAGPKVQITGPAAPTAVMLAVDGSTGAAAFADAGATAFSTPVTAFGTLGAGTTNFTLHIEVGVSNGANAGTVAVQLAANGAGTLTVQPGSFCRIQ